NHSFAARLTHPLPRVCRLGERADPVIDRRTFLAGTGAVLLAAPLAVEGQQAGKIPRVGILLFGTPDTDPSLPSFHAGLHALGYAEGRNILLEYPYAEGNPDPLPRLAPHFATAHPTLLF